MLYIHPKRGKLRALAYLSRHFPLLGCTTFLLSWPHYSTQYYYQTWEKHKSIVSSFNKKEISICTSSVYWDLANFLYIVNRIMDKMELGGTPQGVTYPLSFLGISQLGSNKPTDRYLHPGLCLYLLQNYHCKETISWKACCSRVLHHLHAKSMTENRLVGFKDTHEIKM